MRRWHKINLTFFLTMIFATCSMIYVIGTMNYSTSFSKPWHLLTSVHEDSLSTLYKDNYEIMGSAPLRTSLYDSSRTNVFILIDAWGVPVQEEKLQENMKIFEHIPHRFGLHRRLADYTRHAEHVEFRNNYDNSIYLFGGDSVQYGRQEYIPKLGFQQSLYCNRCENNSIIKMIDSLLNVKDSIPNFIAWTALASSVGGSQEIEKLLLKIETLAQKYPEVQFVLQGTHRPIMCDSQIKRTYKSHWVPVVVLSP